mgnify:CR=1 FL=1
MHFDLKNLPYPIDALAPHISKETLELHHGKHHATYVKKLSDLVAGTEFEKMSLEDVVKKSSGPMFNNAAQAWNHDYYWSSLTPKAGKPSGALATALDAAFGSFAALEQGLKYSATTTFGSG